jgi:hypothetical protein
MSSHVVRVVAVALLLCGTTLVRAEVGPDGMSAAELKDFLAALQTAVRLGDSTQVARFMYFPLRVNSDKGVTHSYGGVAFARNFEQIFSPALRTAVLKQDAAEMMRSTHGAMVGDGRVWIANVCLDHKCTKRKICVTAINLGDPAHPPPAATPAHPPH